MVWLRSRAEQVLGAILAELPEPHGPVVTDIRHRRTALVLGRLAKTPPESISENDRADLHALCRKIAVSKDVLDEYDEDWKATPGAAPLGDPLRALLIGVLLKHAGVCDSEDEPARGLRFKCLNAALSALDRYSASAASSLVHLSVLRELAGEVLAVVGGEVRT